MKKAVIDLSLIGNWIPTRPCHQSISFAMLCPAVAPFPALLRKVPTTRTDGSCTATVFCLRKQYSSSHLYQRFSRGIPGVRHKAQRLPLHSAGEPGGQAPTALPSLFQRFLCNVCSLHGRKYSLSSLAMQLSHWSWLSCYLQHSYLSPTAQRCYPGSPH